jgi:membrane-associated protease RseP (regulator of RpoE activity)
MESLTSKLKNFLVEVMDIKCSKMEHFSLVWEGSLKIPEKEALEHITKKADSLNLDVAFKNKEDGIAVAFRPKPERRESKKWINLLLLGITFLTTLTAGALLREVNPFVPITNLLKGLPLSISIMIILGGHELGHYFMARKNNVDATLPYFIPGPTIVGTFGAVIKMKSPIRDRNALIEIGAAGPIVGFIFATIALLIGLSLSEFVPATGNEGFSLGYSILFKFLTKIYFSNIPEEKGLLLNPIALAGWVGYLITALNLLPIGQLDGGHILYALIGKKAKIVGYVIFGIAILLINVWLGWIIWAILFLVIGFNHPPPLDRISPLSKRNKIIGIISFVMFILTFMPIPVHIKL